MTLSFAQLKQVAELVYNPGYMLLIDSLQAHLDDISQELLAAEPSHEAKILAKWRAASEYLSIMKNGPENIALDLKNQQEMEEQVLGPQMPTRFVSSPGQNLSTAQLNVLKDAYDRKMKKQQDPNV